MVGAVNGVMLVEAGKDLINGFRRRLRRHTALHQLTNAVAHKLTDFLHGAGRKIKGGKRRIHAVVQVAQGIQDRSVQIENHKPIHKKTTELPHAAANVLSERCKKWE